MSVFFFVIIIVGLVTCGRVVQTYLDQSAQRPLIDPARDEEVGRLREQVEYLASEVDRLSEEQRFMTRLLEGTPAGSARHGQTEPGGGDGPDPNA